MREQLERVAVETEVDLDYSTIILGSAIDPFVPFRGKFDAALKATHFLASIAPKNLCLRTRSPLVVLLVPVLKALGSRARVAIALESRSDIVSRQAFPELPLRKAGIDVLLEVTAPKEEKDLSGYARLLHETGCRVVFPSTIGDGEVQRRGEDRSKTVREYFSKLAPSKLVTDVCRDWFARENWCAAPCEVLAA